MADQGKTKPAAGPAIDGKLLLRSLEAVENLWVGTLERAVHSKKIVGLGLRWLDVKLLLRRARQAAARRALGFWGLPDASHTQEVLTLLQSLEERLLRLEDGLADLRVPSAVVGSPYPPAASAPAPAAEEVAP